MLTKKSNVMSTFCFTQNGFHYFLVANDDGYHRLLSDADSLQYLKTNEKDTEVITSITSGETVLLTIGQRFEENYVTEILRIDENNSKFKIKLSRKKS